MWRFLLWVGLDTITLGALCSQQCSRNMLLCYIWNDIQHYEYVYIRLLLEDKKHTQYSVFVCTCTSMYGTCVYIYGFHSSEAIPFGF